MTGKMQSRRILAGLAADTAGLAGRAFDVGLDRPWRGDLTRMGGLR